MIRLVYGMLGMCATATTVVLLLPLGVLIGVGRAAKRAADWLLTATDAIWNRALPREENP